MWNKCCCVSGLLVELLWTWMFELPYSTLMCYLGDTAHSFCHGEWHVCSGHHGIEYASLTLKWCWCSTGESASLFQNGPVLKARQWCNWLHEVSPIFFFFFFESIELVTYIILWCKMLYVASTILRLIFFFKDWKYWKHILTSQIV